MRSRYHQHRGDWKFRVIPWFIAATFVVVISLVVIQFAVMGWAGYHVLTDPEGTANAVGTVLGEVVRPVADAVKGE